MLCTFRVFCKYPSNNIGARLASVAFISQNKFEISNKKRAFHKNASSSSDLGKELNLFRTAKHQFYLPLEVKRHFSKKKGSKRNVEVEESDSDEDEDFEESGIEDDLGGKTISRQVTSMRLDAILKVGLNLTKKKIEQEFYSLKLRVNGVQATKKSMNVFVGDELDLVKGYSPETSKYLTVDRVVVKGVGKLTNSGKYPVDLEVLKELIIENYENPWSPSNVKKLEELD